MAGYLSDKNGNLTQFAGLEESNYKANRDASNLTGADKTAWQEVLGFTLPLGMIVSSTIHLNDSRLVPLNGTVISQEGAYSQFVTWLKTQMTIPNAVPTCSLSDYSIDIATTGQCGKFVINDTEETITSGNYSVPAKSIKVPTITKFIEGLTSISDIGSALSAGLPNITGAVTQIAVYNFGASGAFSGASTGESYGRGGTSSSPHYRIAFDANSGAQVKGIYGNSNTVQPQAVKYPYYIVVATGIKTDVEVDIDNVMADINLLHSQKADKNIILTPNGTYETLVPTNNAAYTAPANGWFAWRCHSSSSSYSHITLENQTNGMWFRHSQANNSAMNTACFPVKAGDVVALTISNCAFTESGEYFRFYYGGGVN